MSTDPDLAARLIVINDCGQHAIHAEVGDEIGALSRGIFPWTDSP